MVSEPLGTWTRRVRWDEAGRLLAAWGEGAGAPAGTWAFAYDHSGERVLKYRIEDGQVAGATLFLRDEQGNVLSEMQWVDTGAAGYWARAKDHVYLGRDLIGSFDRGTGEPHVVSYARDHLGSQRAEVWGPDTSTATDLWPYGALARTKAAGGPPALANGAHLFTGHEREYTGSEALADPLMGLDYMHARYYSNTLGRFLSVDSVGGKPGLSQSWNRYAYVRGNPLSAFDPSGEKLRVIPKNVADWYSNQSAVREGKMSASVPSKKQLKRLVNALAKASRDPRFREVLKELAASDKTHFIAAGDLPAPPGKVHAGHTDPLIDKSGKTIGTVIVIDFNEVSRGAIAQKKAGVSPPLSLVETVSHEMDHAKFRDEGIAPADEEAQARAFGKSVASNPDTKKKPTEDEKQAVKEMLDLE